MSQQPARWRIVVLWLCTIVAGLGIGIAGLSKFPASSRWPPLFLGWGYPPWFTVAVGAAEVCGAVLLFIPRYARYGTGLLFAVMAGALITLLTHPGGTMGWGATPAFYMALLGVIALMRRRLSLQGVEVFAKGNEQDANAAEAPPSGT